MRLVVSTRMSFTAPPPGLPVSWDSFNSIQEGCCLVSGRQVFPILSIRINSFVMSLPTPQRMDGERGSPVRRSRKSKEKLL